MIPKVIHYCWFGGQPLPELAQKCIASWRRYCPGYEIKEWNEGNYDIKNACDYVREAYDKKMWAFVSDYARFDILYRYGGVYFDTDVELIRPIDDILAKGPFMGLEDANGKREMPAPGLGIAAYPGMEIYKELLDYYAGRHFEADEDGDYKTVVTITDEVLSRHGEIRQGQISEVAGITIYPTEYFCPLSFFDGEMRDTENTRAVHHYAATWLTKEGKKMTEIRMQIAGASAPIRLIGKMRIYGLRFVEIAKKQGITRAFSKTLQFAKKSVGGGLNEALGEARTYIASLDDIAIANAAYCHAAIDQATIDDFARASAIFGHPAIGYGTSLVECGGAA